VRDLTRGGVDFAFEISGAKSAMATANAITCKGGDVVCVGLGASGEMYQYPHTTLVAEQKGIRGSLMGAGVAERDIPLYIEFYKSGRMPVDRLKSATMGFAELNVSLDRLDSGDVVRQMLLPHG
jgi:alcohol dehydrogenase